MKISGLKDFSSKKYRSNRFGIQKYLWVNNMFGKKRILNDKKNATIDLGQQNFLVQNNFSFNKKS